MPFSVIHIPCQAFPVTEKTLEGKDGLLREVICAVHLPSDSKQRIVLQSTTFLLDMYDKYVVSQDSQNTAQISLNVMCKWVQFIKSHSSGRSLRERREKCAAYRLHQMYKLELLADFNSHIKASKTNTVEPLYNGHHWGMRFWPL